MKFIAGPVKKIVTDDAVLCGLPMLIYPDALKVIDAWGLNIKRLLYMEQKEKKWKASLFYRANGLWKDSEICVYWQPKAKHTNWLKSHKVRQLVETERDIHSRKPQWS